MNKVVLIGRLCRDLNLRQTQSGTNVLDFVLAVDRRKKDEADYIDCVAWSKTAELMNQYLKKGDEVAVSGRIETGTHNNKDGVKVYTTRVIAEDVQFLRKKQGYIETETDNDNPWFGE